MCHASHRPVGIGAMMDVTRRNLNNYLSAQNGSRGTTADGVARLNVCSRHTGYARFCS
jgi:hypothetical protein